MFVLNVDIDVKDGRGSGLETTFRKVFVPAISVQEGFARAELLRPNESGNEYRLVIAFEDQHLQQRWVASTLHQEVWPQMEVHGNGYSVQNYTLVT